MSEEQASYDVVPESRGDQAQSVENTMFETAQARMMEEQAELRAACIENGDDAEKFLNSNFGQYLLGQADLEAEQAKESLTEADPRDFKTITRLQNRIKRARSLEQWVSSAIEQGNAEYNDYLQSKIANNEG